jgi:hypothetical protein
VLINPIIRTRTCWFLHAYPPTRDNIKTNCPNGLAVWILTVDVFTVQDIVTLVRGKKVQMKWGSVFRVQERPWEGSVDGNASEIFMPYLPRVLLFGLQSPLHFHVKRQQTKARVTSGFIGQVVRRLVDFVFKMHREINVFFQAHELPATQFSRDSVEVYSNSQKCFIVTKLKPRRIYIVWHVYLLLSNGSVKKPQQ